MVVMRFVAVQVAWVMILLFVVLVLLVEEVGSVIFPIVFVSVHELLDVVTFLCFVIVTVCVI